jgi:hypothetical protein
MYERGPSERTEMPLAARVVRPGTFAALGATLVEQFRRGDDALRGIIATVAPLTHESLEPAFNAEVVPAAEALDWLDRPEDAADHAAMVASAAAAGFPIDQDRSQLPGPDEPLPGLVFGEPQPWIGPGEGRPGLPPPETPQPEGPGGPFAGPPAPAPQPTPTPAPPSPTPTAAPVPPPPPPEGPGVPPPEQPGEPFTEAPVTETYAEAYLQGESMRVLHRTLARVELAWIATRIPRRADGLYDLAALRAFVRDVEDGLQISSLS